MKNVTVWSAARLLLVDESKSRAEHAAMDRYGSTVQPSAVTQYRWIGYCQRMKEAATQSHRGCEDLRSVCKRKFNGRQVEIAA